MKILKRIRKRRVIGLFFIIGVLLYGIVRSKNYTITYQYEQVSIQESYSKQNYMYQFLFQVENQEFFVYFESKYKHAKKFIKEVEVKVKENTICLFPKGNEFTFYPLCKKDGEFISYHLIDDSDIIPKEYFKEWNTQEEEYNNLKLYNLDNHKYFVWNYKGFYMIDKKNIKEISLFSNDVYTVSLVMQVGNYLLIADYESNYIFRKFYVINSKTGKVKELILDEDMPFESYFLGSTDTYAYLVDKKNKLEYEIYPKKLKYRNITTQGKGKIFINGEWQSIGMQSLVANEQKFSVSSFIKYEIKDQVLYAIINEKQVRITNQSVKQIVYFDNESVYYLVDDKLYSFNFYEGEILVLSNFEWNFNYQNMIYIF